MTEKEVYKNGVALLEEWEDVNYCEHSFKFKDEWLTDKEVVDKLNELNDEIEFLQFALDSNREVTMEVEQEQCRLYKKLEKENKELKKEIKGFESCSHNWGLLYDEAKNKVEELSRENKELKEENEKLKQLLKEVDHELSSIHGLTAFDKCSSQLGYVEVFDNDRIELDYMGLIERIDKELR